MVTNCSGTVNPGAYHVFGTVDGSSVEWSWFSGECDTNTGALSGNALVGTRNCSLSTGQFQNSYTVTLTP